MRTSAVSPVSLDQHIVWWREAGLITTEQAEAIVEQERRWAAQTAQAAQAAQTVQTGSDGGRPREGEPTTGRLPLVVEALGYIGGVLSLVGAVLLLSRYWTDMSLAVRLGLGVAVSLVLMVAGLVLHETDPALVRLRWSLWLLSSAAAGVTTGLLALDGFDAEAPIVVALAVAVVVGLQNAFLWAGRMRPVQQALALASIPVIAGAAAAQVAGMTVTGLVVALAGVVVLGTGLSGRTVLPALTDGIGAVALVAGVALTIDDRTGPGLLAVIAVAAGLMALALLPRGVERESERVVLSVIGIVTMVQALPQTLAWFSRDAGIATGLVLAAVGAGMMLVAQRRMVRVPVFVVLHGGAAMVGGFALMGRQSVTLATVVGLTAAVAMLVVGTRPGWAVLSLVGAAALLVNVPWAIWWFFPGEDRAPLLTTVSGAVIIGVAVLLARMRGRLRHELSDQAVDRPPTSITA
jgi:hypothetical protein